MAALLQALVVLVVVAGVVAILRIWVLPMLGTLDPRVPATVNVLIWVIVGVYVLYVVAGLLFCLLGGGPMIPLRR
jgi:type II secretory pathway component PulF